MAIPLVSLDRVYIEHSADTDDSFTIFAWKCSSHRCSHMSCDWNTHSLVCFNPQTPKMILLEGNPSSSHQLCI